MAAPAPSCAFQPLPNHHTLKQRLSALRVVNTRFVLTLDTRCQHTRWSDARTKEDERGRARTDVSWFTPETQTSCVTRLTARMRYGASRTSADGRCARPGSALALGESGASRDAEASYRLVKPNLMPGMKKR